MSGCEGSSKSQEQTAKDSENSVKSAIEILKEERESVLAEVLRCCVCLELPVGKQVKICEEGHHFCVTCHNKIEFCGICRGKLLATRNFVVEQLVVKMGTVFGYMEQDLPPAKPPYILGKGIYPCLHQCIYKTPAFKMLTHLRNKHKENLVEKVRSNPYSERFSFVVKILFNKNKKYIWSVQVCDMGLFTVDCTFVNFKFFGCARMLAEANPPFKYQLVMKIPNQDSGSVSEFSVTDCPMSSYLDDIESVKNGGRGLNMQSVNLLELVKEGSALNVFFSVWENPKKPESEISLYKPSVFSVPEKDLYFENDRTIRRNRNRNMRRKRLRESLRGDYDFYAGSDTLSVADVFGVLVL